MVGRLSGDDDKKIALRVRAKLRKLANQEPPVEGESQGHKIFLYPIASHIMAAMKQGPVPSTPLNEAVDKISSLKEKLEEVGTDVETAVIMLEDAPGKIAGKSANDLQKRNYLIGLHSDLYSLWQGLNNLINHLEDASDALKKLHPSLNVSESITKPARSQKALPGKHPRISTDSDLRARMAEVIVTLNTAHGDLGKTIGQWEEVLKPQRVSLQDGSVRYRLSPHLPPEYSHSIINLGEGMAKLQKTFGILDEEIHGLYMRVLEEQVRLEMSQGPKTGLPPH